MSIKSIKEKELLVNFARAMGQEVDPRLVEDVERINAIRNSVRASVSENIFKDLGAAVSNYEPDDGPLTEVQLEQIKESVQIEFPKPPSLDELLLVLNEQIEEVKNELVQTQPQEESPKTETPVSDTTEPVAKQTLADRTSEFLSKSKDSYQQPDPLTVTPDMDAVTKKLRFLEQWISKVSMAGPGSGEVNLRYLDDVYRPNILPQSFLYYNNTINKFDFTTNITNFVDIENTSRSFGNFYDTTDQIYANVSVGQLVNLGNVGLSKNITLQSNGSIVFGISGDYLVNYSLQFVNTDNEQRDVNVWLKKNGNNISDSNSIFTIPVRKNTSISGKLIATTPIAVSVLSNDIIELYWHTDTNLITLKTINPQGSSGPDIPNTPGAIVTVSKL